MASHSPERMHANKLWNKIFKVLSKQMIQQNTLKTKVEIKVLSDK